MHGQSLVKTCLYITVNVDNRLMWCVIAKVPDAMQTRLFETVSLNCAVNMPLLAAVCLKQFLSNFYSAPQCSHC